LKSLKKNQKSIVKMKLSKDTMTISTNILKEWYNIASSLYRFDCNAILNAKDEPAYFKKFIPDVVNYLNSLKLLDRRLSFICSSKEVHKTPIVKFDKDSPPPGCELADYFIVVEYRHNGHPLGRKVIFYQFKISKKGPKWDLKQKQLTLLKDWPKFTCGGGKNPPEFSIKPTKPEFGSYWLGDKYNKNSLFLTAYDVACLKNKNSIKVDNPFRYCLFSAPISLLMLIAWRIGEDILPQSDIEKLVTLLLSKSGNVPSSAGAFKGNSFTLINRGNVPFALEICVNYEG
jgi:hypothetical protein